MLVYQRVLKLGIYSCYGMIDPLMSCSVQNLIVFDSFESRDGSYHNVNSDNYPTKWRLFQLDSARYVSSLEGIGYMYLSLMASYVPICLMIKNPLGFQKSVQKQWYWPFLVVRYHPKRNWYDWIPSTSEELLQCGAPVIIWFIYIVYITPLLVVIRCYKML